MKNEIITLLKNNLSCKVYDYNPTSQNQLPYVVLKLSNERDFSLGDDENKPTKYRFQIDIFSKTDYTDIKNQIDNLLKTQNFITIKTFGAELYENKTKIYHYTCNYEIEKF